MTADRTGASRSSGSRTGKLAVIALSAVLAGCISVPLNMTPEQRQAILWQVREGQPILDCREFSCIAAWGANRQQFIALHNSRQWEELAVRVGVTGYKDNLAYYYLGRAAEGLGWWEAANRYYRVSNTLTYTQYACDAGGFNNCNLFAFPDDLVIRMAAVEAASRKSSGAVKTLK